MENIIALLVGLLVAVGAYLVFSRNLFRILLGLALLAQAANVLVFASAGLGDGTTPIIPPDADGPARNIPDPLAQALVLTAIVISFGVLAFCLTLLKKTHGRTGGSSTDMLSKTEGDRR
jgi:multicomponent Na+:H+ antiporter subunit C